MGHTVQYIEDAQNTFLPSWNDRIKGALSYAFNGITTSTIKSFKKDWDFAKAFMPAPYNLPMMAEPLISPTVQRFEKFISDHFEPKVPEATYSIPEGMEVEESIIKDGDLEYKCCHYKAPNAGHALYVFGGLRSTAKGKHMIFDVARRAGISVIFGELPVDENDADFELIEGKMSESFLLKTPYFEEYKDIPRYLMGHSTGGYCIAKALWDNDEKTDAILEKFDCTSIFGGYFQAGYMAHIWQQVLYPIHAFLNRHKEVGDNLGDGIYNIWNILSGNPYIPSTKENPFPRHSEILSFAKKIENRRERLLSKPFPTRVRESGKISFIHGKYDGIAVPKASKTIAKHMNAPYLEMDNTYHNPYTENRIAIILYHLFNPANAKIREPQISRAKEAFSRVHPGSIIRLLRRAKPKPKADAPEATPAVNLPALRAA